MPEPASTRLALIGPAGATDAIADGDDIINDIIARLEAVGAAWQQGTSRPAAAAALEGFFYVHTGTGHVSFCTGSVWIEVGDLVAPTLSNPARALDTAYQPSATRPVLVTATILLIDGGANNPGCDLLIENANPPTVARAQIVLTVGGGSAQHVLTGMVPAGWYYKLAGTGSGTKSLSLVTEYAL